MTCPIVVDVVEHIERCVEFAKTMGELNQSHEFNNAYTAQRKPTQIARDHVIGKVAEVAVYEFLTRCGVELELLDFEVHGANARDDHDIVSKENGRTVSVKSTEKGRYLFIHHGNASWNVANGYVLCKTEMVDNVPNGKVHILGFATFADIFNKDEFRKWQEVGGDWPDNIPGALAGLVRAGQRSPAGDFPMQSTNVYVPPGRLRTDLVRLVDALKQNPTS